MRKGQKHTEESKKKMGPIPRPPKVLFRNKIYRAKNGCWIWKGGKDQNGYGWQKYKGRMEKAHRFSWMIFKSPIPKNILVCHHCDNPSCVNPTHLFLATNKENLQDASRKGRLKYPEERRRQRSIAYNGKDNPFYGKRHTKEARKKQSENHAGGGIPWTRKSMLQ